MAYFDHEEAARIKERTDEYKKLKRYLASNDKWEKALEHIKDMEEQMKKQEERIQEYEKFFKMLQHLLPLSYYHNLDT